MIAFSLLSSNELVNPTAPGKTRISDSLARATSGDWRGVVSVTTDSPLERALRATTCRVTPSASAISGALRERFKRPM